ncbi:MAG TPA: Gfo/Idh/MocA family oxidoreductase [Rhodothermales bacterium]|nr:Gfo/Idh/MocA family oxidoreductase [Rhodothermales bacterium]
MNNTRRDFLKTSVMATAGLIASGHFAWANVAETLKVGLIGCGGRGTGAARDCVAGSEGITIWAMGDLFEDRLDSSYAQLKQHIGDKLQVPEARKFTGFDAYQKVLASGVDVVILASPPGFRPAHFEAAVNAGKHIFMEKPVAVDPAGIRKVLAAAELSVQKKLCVVAGTQRRHDPKYVETIQRLHDNAIGDIVTGQVYWNQGGLWKYDRKPGMSDMEWQIRNWLYFTWTSGDHIVEQHIHNIDVANWVMKGHPVKAIGMGGRQVRVDPAYGHIFDHFAIEFEYANGVKILSMCRQQDGTESNVSEFFYGTKGTSNAKDSIRGAQSWRYKGTGPDVNPYVNEHTNLVKAIRSGNLINEAKQVAESNLSAIMGREAAYTGSLITWDDLLNANQDLSPAQLIFGDVPVAPVAHPGITKINRPAYGHFFESKP